MIIEKKYLTLGMNGDDSGRELLPGQSLNLMNCREGVTEFGRAGRQENIAGTTLVNQQKFPPYGFQQCMGTAIDFQRNRLIFFEWNSFGDHGIYVYTPSTNQILAVLYDSQVVGGLNFSKDFRINRNAKVIGDLLYWTDNLNEPKKINIEAAIKANQADYVTTVVPYQFPLNYWVETWIKRPPSYALTWTRVADSSFLENHVHVNAFQFLYYYDFRDYDFSALSDYSALVPFELEASELTENAILIKIPFAEKIEQDVQKINIVAKYGNNGSMYIINTFDKGIPADAAAIIAHNAGITQLSYQFYNTILGIPLDKVFAATPFDEVPLLTKTIELASNRAFLGNNLSGYTSPLVNKLEYFPTTDNEPPRIFKTGSTYKLSIDFKDRFRRKCGVVNINVPVTIPQRTYDQVDFIKIITWVLTNENALNEIPLYAYFYQILISKNQSKAFFVEVQTQDISYAVKDNNGLITYTSTIYNAVTTYAIAVDISALTPLGLGYTYAAGDYAVLYRNPTTNFTLPVIGQIGNNVLLQPKDIGVITNSFRFTLTPTSGLNEGDRIPMTIPVAYVQNGFLVSSQAPGTISGAVTDQVPPNLIFEFTDGNSYTFSVNGTITVSSTDNSGSEPFILNLVIGAEGLSNDNVLIINEPSPVDGQTYIYNINTTITVPVPTDPVKKAVIVLLYENPSGTLPVGNIISGFLTFSRSTDYNLIELYTPYTPQEGIEEPLYEIGDMYPINNPGTPSRAYSQLDGDLVGDAYLLQRTSGQGIVVGYLAEAVSPNDLVWQNWQRDLGWSNIVDTIGQTQQNTQLIWSDVYIFGTKTNGLGKFQPTDSTDVGYDNVAIQKLQLANKIQEQGHILLIICTESVLSAYLGEVQLVGASANADLATTENVIGTINLLKGNFGTQNPETIIEYLGLVFGLDANNGVWWQYSSNGLEDVSRYKEARFFKRYCSNYISASKLNLDNINGFHHIPSCIDPFNKEILVTLPALIYQNYAAILPSYSAVPPYATSIINRFDIYDELGKTMVFKFEENKWNNDFEFMPEWMDYLQNTLFGFKNGNLYIHNSDTTNWNTFYGVQYPIRICLVANANPSAIKDLFRIGIEGSVAPDYTVAYATYPNVQITDLTAAEYTNDEGVFYAPFFRDRLSPNCFPNGTPEQKMYQGDILKDAVLKIMCEFQQYSGLVYINFINIGYGISKAQKQIIVKPS